MTKISEIQDQAKKAWMKKKRGTLEKATGTGKSKTALDILSEFKGYWLLVVPTETLRDIGWPNEFKKWNMEKDLERVEIICYNSLVKYMKDEFEGIIFDEIHYLTEAKLHIAHQIKHAYVLGLTATLPPDKNYLLQGYCPSVFEYDLDSAKEDKVVSNFKINTILHRLNEKDKNIVAGNAKKRFETTEKGQYDFLTKQVQRAFNMGRQGTFDPVKVAIGARARFLYNLPSKAPVIKKLIEGLPEGSRTVLFGENTKLLDEITPYAMHSHKTKAANDKLYKDFNDKKINLIGSAKKLKEGHNLTDVNTIILASYNSTIKDLIQKIGRGVRFQEGKLTNIYIICTFGTQEETWYQKMTAPFDKSNINILTDNLL